MSTVLTLLPGLAAQFILGFILIGLFVQSGDEVPFWKPIFASLVMVLVGTVMGIFLTPYLYQGTIVMQWFMFVLLGKALCSMPLDKSMMAQFCLFSWMLGIGLMQDRFFPSPADEPTEPDAASEWVDKTRQALLPNSMLLARNAAITAMYDLPEEDEPQPKPVVVQSSKDPVDPDLPEETATPAPQAAAPLVMTGAEFETLFYDTSASPSELVPIMGTSDDQIFVDPSGEGFAGEFEELTQPTTIDPDQSQEIVQVQNRSTDPDFVPPGFSIGAVSSGKKGKFAMVDGRLLREGAILRTGATDPRGWKLHRITETDLFWQPLK